MVNRVLSLSLLICACLSLAACKNVVGFTVKSTDNSQQRDVPVTIGQVFRQGDVPANQTLMATSGNTFLPTQVDKKATWPDGSLRHAVISTRLASLAAGASQTIALNVVEPSDDNPGVTLDELLGTDFDAIARIDKDGRTYRVSARDFLARAQQTGACSARGKRCKRWLSGPLASEWIVGGALSTGGQADAHLAVYFHVRAYADGRGSIGRARVDTVIENTWTYPEKTGNQRYDATIRVGERAFEVDDLQHYRQARWHKVLWWQDKPDVYARLDGEYLQATKAISNYADLDPANAFLDAVPQSFPPMTRGDQKKQMGGTGAAAGIGPLPRWTSTYVVSMDRRAKNWMLANDDAVGSYAFHYRDAETGRPVTITDHPYITIANYGYASTAIGGYYDDLLPRCNGDCATPLKFDIAHHPSIGYVPYLVTGDYYYLEEMQFAASYVELWPNPGYRDYAQGLLTNGPHGNAQGQVRGQAWALRSLSDAAFATPDNDALKGYFTRLMKNILASYNATYTDESDRHNPLHILNRGGAIIYPKGPAAHSIATWQEAFFTWAVGHAAEQGFAGADRLLTWLAPFHVGTMTDWQTHDDGFCWLAASDYSVRVRDGNTHRSPMYPDLTTVFKKSRPRLAGLECNSQAMANQLTRNEDGRYEIGEMLGYAHSPTGFPSNIQIGLAMATDSGIDRGPQAWAIFDNRSVKPNYRNYPNFAVVPRN